MTLTMFESNFILVNYDVVVVFPNYNQFGAIWKSKSKCTVYNSYFFINNGLLSNKSLTQSSYYLLRKRLYFYPIMLTFAIKMLTSGLCYYKVYFLILLMCLDLCTDFKVFSLIILRQGAWV